MRAILSRRLVAVLLLSPLLVFTAFAQVHPQASEYQVKAVFLLNFTKFIEWPPAAFEDARSPISICLFGEDPFDGMLNQLVEGEIVNGRKVVVQKIRLAPSSKTCQVLFVGKAQKDVPKTLAGLGPGVLTVGEGDGFLRDGGIIAFVLESRRIRFDINQSAASNAALTISSRLLSVAKSVEK